LIPFIMPLARQEELGEWFPRRSRLAQIIVAVLVLMILSLTVLALLPAG